jgi:hypothetical protein
MSHHLRIARVAGCVAGGGLVLGLVLGGTGGAPTAVTAAPAPTVQPPLAALPKTTVAPRTVRPTTAARTSSALARAAAPRVTQARPQLADELVASGTWYQAGQDRFLQLPETPVRRPNAGNRPLFVNRGTGLVRWSGVVMSGTSAPSLIAMMQALHAEGDRLGDLSARYAQVVSGWRPNDVSEGQLYLDALRATISGGGYPPFPPALEAVATSELGIVGSPAFRVFEDALAASPGWDAATAHRVVVATGEYKAPRGGSPHHSGLAVDIDWPVLADGRLVYHHESRALQDAALHTVAGRWLYENAPRFGFDTYDTDAEIWHWEWRQCPGTAADLR